MVYNLNTVHVHYQSFTIKTLFNAHYVRCIIQAFLLIICSLFMLILCGLQCYYYFFFSMSNRIMQSTIRDTQKPPKSDIS